MSIVPSEEMDPDIAAAIAQIWQGPNGEVRVRLHDKLAALVALGKHLGIFVQGTQNTNVHYAISDKPLSVEEWVKRHVTPN